MSDKRRRLLCRIAFVLCCIVPTTVVGIRIFFPTSAREWQFAIDRSLGVSSNIKSVGTPTPYKSVLSSVSLRTHRDKRPIDLESVEVLNVRHTVLVNIESAIVGDSSLVEILKHVYARFSTDSEDSKPFRINIAELVVENGNDSSTQFSVSDLIIQVDPGGSSPRISASFKVPGGNQIPIICKLRRQWNGSDWSSFASIETGTTTLPCWLLKDVWPAVSRLGSEAEFSGNLIVQREDHTQTPTLNIRQSTLVNVDLKQLVQIPFGRVLTGKTRIEIRQLVVENGGVSELLVWAFSPQGTIGKSLLGSARTWLQIETPTVYENEVAFRNLAVGIQIRDGMIGFWNGTKDAPIANDSRGEPLAIASTGSAQLPLLHLVNCLAPKTKLEGPVSQSTAQLISILPTTDRVHR